ncbi:hypothetical protein D3C71_1242230 [compost metagenome]
MHRARLDHHPRQPRRQPTQQLRVAHPAAAHQHTRGAGQVRQQRIGHRGGGQLQQRGLHIGRGVLAIAHARLRPGQVELLAPGALGRRQREPGIGQPLRQQRLVVLPTGRKCPIRIEGHPAMALAPCIHQRIGRAGIEAPRHAVARDQGQVGDAPQVEDRPVFVGGAQHRQVEGRHQRRAMPARGHVAAAEIGHRGDPCRFGNPVGIAKLHRERRIAQRPVPHGLPVRADRPHLRPVHAAAFQQGIGRGAEGDPDLRIDPSQRIQRFDSAAFAERNQFRPQRRVPRMGVAGHEPAAARLGKLHQRGIDAVGAGAGHQAEVKGAMRINDSGHGGTVNTGCAQLPRNPLPPSMRAWPRAGAAISRGCAWPAWPRWRSASGPVPRPGRPAARGWHRRRSASPCPGYGPAPARSARGTPPARRP